MKTNYLMILGLVFSSVATAVICAAQQPETKPATPYYGVKSPDAVAAFKGFETNERLARTEYFRNTDAARAKLIATLTASMDKATKAGNLDEAVKLRDAIADLKGGNAPPRAETKTNNGTHTVEQLVKALAGTKWAKVLDTPGGFTITLNEDMSVTSSHHQMKGTWAVVNGNTLRMSVSMNGCGGDSLTISPDGTQLIRTETGKPDFKRKDK